MTVSNLPKFPAAWQPLVAQAANELRQLALDEKAKARFCDDPILRPYMQRVAKRYVAGETIQDLLRRIQQINARGHAGSAEYMGESCRDEGKALAETAIFLELIAAIDRLNLRCSISLDLSHVGSVIDAELGFQNVKRIATAAASVGREVMISMEGSDRADNIYATYGRLHTEAGLSNIGITVPAKLHRTEQDLPVLMTYPGRIRLVKGAFLEAENIAYSRNSPELAACYRRYAKTLLSSGHQCSIATHDAQIQEELSAFISSEDVRRDSYEFESLIGLGTDLLDSLQRRGFVTREYAVFGEEYFLYVLNRIAEEPVRLYQAVIDVMAASS
ncbi:proline dehydrogenase family protein [Undibacterium sp. TC4M20W]|uniref:proline dehydrogenase family protein n=1 Tax=Undibacterium sp. TC4M20W TaxID=3413052 RepID=UPI003BEF7E23